MIDDIVDFACLMHLGVVGESPLVHNFDKLAYTVKLIKTQILTDYPWSMNLTCC